MLHQTRAIAIPSMKRAGSMPTLRLLEEVKLKYPVFIFTEPDEVEEYKLAHPEYVIVGVTKPRGGIGYTRKFIQDFFYQVKTSTINIDDDIENFYKDIGKTEKGYPKIRKCNPVEMFDKWFDEIEQHHIVGLQATQHLWTLQKDTQENMAKKFNTFFADGEWQLVRRIWTCYGYSPKLQESGVVFDESMKVYEDFDWQIQAILKGFQTPCLTKYAWKSADKHYAVRPGGCQEMDRRAVSLEMAQAMVVKHGDKFCSMKIKKNTGFLEVQPKWKNIVRAGIHKHSVDILK